MVDMHLPKLSDCLPDPFEEKKALGVKGTLSIGVDVEENLSWPEVCPFIADDDADGILFVVVVPRNGFVVVGGARSI